MCIDEQAVVDPDHAGVRWVFALLPSRLQLILRTNRFVLFRYGQEMINYSRSNYFVMNFEPFVLVHLPEHPPCKPT
jgi:hypothetical protein